MRWLLIFGFVGLTFIRGFGQTDNVGSGHAIKFDGVDDYIDLGNILDDLVFPFSISSWVKVDPASPSGPVFVSQDNGPNYNGFWFYAFQTGVMIEYGDGRGEGSSAFRRGKRADNIDMAGRWNHVCAVVKGPNDMTLYVNGRDVGGNYQGDTNLPMASQFPTDIAKMGYFISNSVEYRFKGQIDELRIYNRALPIEEIRKFMCVKLPSADPEGWDGLIGYWTFDETSGNTVLDKSPNHFNGTLVNNPTRVFSGAPLGESGSYLYPTSWSGNSVSFVDGQVLITVSNIIGDPAGVHIYNVEGLPSQTGGLDVSQVFPYYYGVFTDEIFGNNFFDLEYSINGVVNCSLKGRYDNSIPNWQDQTPINIQNRVEFIKLFTEVNPGFSFDFGSNRTICDQSSAHISSGLDPAGKTFLWNTGQTTPSISVSSSGTYTLQVLQGCEKATDEVTISFLQSPPSDFFEDEQPFCPLSSINLTPIPQPTGITFTWQDNSHNDNYEVTQAGKYWVTLENECGITSDTITFLTPQPFSVDLGDDKIFCDQENATLSTGIDPNGVTFDWSNGETTPTITITCSGNYEVTVSNGCTFAMDTISISFLNSPPDGLSLGDDETLCYVPSKRLQPVEETEGFEFTWQDGSHDFFYDVTQSGTYWLTIENFCGSVSDSVKFIVHNVDFTDVPNVITPNDIDTLNQYFQLDDGFLGSYFAVYNRWGKQVFENPNYQNDWDGRGLGSGVYFYLMRDRCLKEFKGVVSIVR
jgi:Concanavalin A-like lectin/glucanases superfamily/CHU_C Type IX secretion signal domain